MVSKSVLQEQMAKQEYKYGFVSDLDEDKAPKGLNEDIVRLISGKKNEPEWFLEWRLRRDDLQGSACGARDHLLLVLRGGPGTPGPRAEIPGHRGALQRQLLRGPEQRRLQRRFVRLRAARCALPDGTVDVLPDQRAGHRPVRAHPHHRGRGRVRQLPRRLHRPDPGHQPAPRRRRRADRPRQRGDQVLYDPELVSRGQERQRRHLQLRDEAREGARRELESLLDPGRDRLRDHLEVPELHPPGGQLGRRVLLRRAREQLPAGRHGHEDVAHREEHPQHDHLEGHLRRVRPEHVPGPGADPQGRDELPQLQPVRFPLDWVDVRSVHVPGHPGPGTDRADGARGVDLEDRGGAAVLLPGAWHHPRGRHEHDRERLLQAGLPEAPDGVRGGSPEADRREPEPRGHGRVSAPRAAEGTTMLEIKDLHVKVAGKEILKGIDLAIHPGEVHAVMGPNGSGKTTLAQVLAGRVTYEVAGGQARFEGKDLLAMKPEDRAREGVFMAFQYPVEIPGVSNALRVVANGINAMRSPKRAMLVVTHYQRLLDYVVPDFVHVLVDGKIVKSGDADLARNLEKHGYGWILEETPRPPQAARA